MSLTPREIVTRLKGTVEEVEEVGDGVLLIANSNVLSKEDLERVDGVIRARLS